MEATTTDFFEVCLGDPVSLGFPAQYLATGPSGNSSDPRSGSGGTAKGESYATRSSTAAEANAMMRTLHDELRRLAQEKGCQVEGPAELPAEEPVLSFAFSYSKGKNHGTVSVTRTERKEAEYQVAEGKLVYTVKVAAEETVGKP